MNKVELPACVVDVEGRITLWNQEAAELLDLPPEAVIGSEWHAALQIWCHHGSCPLCRSRQLWRDGEIALPAQMTVAVGAESATVTAIPFAIGSEHEIGFIMLAPAWTMGVTTNALPPTPIRPRIRQPNHTQIIEELTQRERDVLSCVVCGLDARSIATKIGVTHATARYYVQRILVKLSVRNKAEAVRIALEHNLIAS